MRTLATTCIFILLVLFAPAPVFLLVSFSTFPLWFWAWAIPNFLHVPWLLLLLVIEIGVFLALFLFLARRVSSYLLARFAHRRVWLILGATILAAICLGAVPIYGGSGVDTPWTFSSVYNLSKAFR